MCGTPVAVVEYDCAPPGEMLGPDRGDRATEELGRRMGNDPVAPLLVLLLLPELEVGRPDTCAVPGAVTGFCGDCARAPFADAEGEWDAPFAGAAGVVV